MKFGEVLDQIGGFGRYQKIQFMLASLPAAVLALHQLASVFLAATPEYSCAENSDETSYNSSDVGADLGTCTYNESRPIGERGNNSSFSSTRPCTSFSYSKEYFDSTIVTEWDLVCDEKYKSTLSTMLYMGGKLAGAFVFGLLSDILGRKKCVLIAILLLAVSGFGTAFSPNYAAFAGLRFVVAACATGMYMCLFVLGMELIGTSYRVLAGIVICYFWVVGYVLLTLISYLSKNWVYTQITITAPILLFLSYYWLVPESARWLLSRNRVDEAKAIVVNAARVNKVQLSPNFDLEDEKIPTARLSALCSARTLLVRSLVIFLNWFAVAMGYYGLSLNSGSLGGSIYLNFLLSGAVEIVAYSACFTINRLGRKGPYIFGMLVAGLACFGTVLVDLLMKDTPQITLNIYFVALNMIGKFGMTMGFCIIYIWSAEVYPTSLRTSLMGVSSVIGRLGQILAPFITDIGDYVPKAYSRLIPAIIFGSFVIISGLLTLILPETAGEDLPETIEDADMLPRKPLKNRHGHQSSKISNYMLENDAYITSETKT